MENKEKQEFPSTVWVAAVQAPEQIDYNSSRASLDHKTVIHEQREGMDVHSC